MAIAAFSNSAPAASFEIDPRRVELDALFDGIYVLRTNTKLTPLQAVLRYRDRWMVEGDIFRTAKSLLATRPIFHKDDQTIRGHIFCSFLALVLRKELEDRLAAAETHPRMGRHRARSATVEGETEIEQDGKRYVLRNTAPDGAQHRPAHARRCLATPGPRRPAAACHTTPPKTPPKTPPP